MVRPTLPTRLTSGFRRQGSFPPSSGQASPNPATSRSTSPRPPGIMTSNNDHHRSGPPGLVLKISAIKGRDLAAKDKRGTSDPFLVVALGDARQSTSVVNRTLNPEWNQTLDFPIAGPDNLLLEVVCWDKDRFRKDYMGEFALPVDEIFAGNQAKQEPKWYRLESRKPGKKNSVVTGEVLLGFELHDPNHSAATSQQIISKLTGLVAVDSPVGEADDDTTDLTLVESTELLDEDDEDDELEEQLDGADDATKAEVLEKKKRRRRVAGLKRKAKKRAYEFTGQSDVAGVLFLEITKVVDLPPERNAIRTGFDMDPFVITSLGKKTFRTRVIRHNLNPVYEEKLVFQVTRHEVNYSLSFTVVDLDRFSGNDFIGSANFPLEKIIEVCPEADPETGLYKLHDPPEGAAPEKKKRLRLPLSRSSSAQNLKQSNRPGLKREVSSSSMSGQNAALQPPDMLAPPPTNSTEGVQLTTVTSAPMAGPTSAPMNIPLHHVTSAPQQHLDPHYTQNSSQNSHNGHDAAELTPFVIPLAMKNRERWEDRHNPTLFIQAKYLPYQALRQQFWRALLRQFDADNSGSVDRIELTTMLDTLGSTLHDSTIDGFFERFSAENHGEEVLSFDQAVICLEDQLQQNKDRSIRDRLPQSLQAKFARLDTNGDQSEFDTSAYNSGVSTPLLPLSAHNSFPLDQGTPGEGEEESQTPNDHLADEHGVEHVVEIRECPICHQPRLHKRSEADIITHIATCASQDWRQVNNIVMAGFVTSSQAQRKWYSKVITKIGYGGYRLGANSANILVQDRITGQINEERMSVYVRLGIRLLYKGLKSREMEKKRIRKLLRSMSFKQGRKFDDPASAAEIQTFINFHRLDMSEVLLPVDQFKNFNEFFYRKLKPDARPCAAPDRPEIVTSPADCRSVVFNRLDDAQKIWVKGREFSIQRLFGDAYPDDVKRYQNGALGIFRLAPQDYHRFHIPVDGIMGEPKQIEGEYYTVNPMAIRSTLDVYGENIRVLVPIDSVAHGRVMVVCIGAMMVGSTVITRKPGEHVKRAEELGYFQFGGSTLLVLFEPGKMLWDADLTDNSSSALETLIRVGMALGHAAHHEPHPPETPVGVAPTAAEKEDAKRRIQGGTNS